MEAVPRMPMIWLELKEAGEFPFSSGVRQYIQKHYGENPENYSEALRKLEQLRKSVVNVPREFEGCNTHRKYFGQLYYLQSRVPMAKGQEAAAPVTWIDIYSGKQITHEEIAYELASVLYNLGALHSYLGAMDNRRSEEGMKMSCTHFQSSAGAFTYIRDNYNCNYSSDMSHQALSINISLMLAQAQECILEKTLLDNRKSSLIAKISAQVCDYYKECVRALESSEGVSGKKDWRKLIQMKISYFSAITHLHMGKQCEEEQTYGKAVAYFQSALDKLNEAIKLSKGQPDSVQEALRFTMDVIGGKFNSAKKDNDFIYHESVPGLDTLAPVKGASLVKPISVTPADPSVTGPDLFSKLVPMATHEASSLYSEEKAKLLREVMAKIDDKNQILQRFMDSLNCDKEANLDRFNTVPPALLEKCAALSVRPDAVKSLAQAMQALSSVYTDVGSSLEEVRSALEEDEAGEKSLENLVGQKALPQRPAALKELQTEFRKYELAHQTASQTNTELHGAMNQHIPNLRLLQGPLDELKKNLPQPQLSQDDMSSLETMKRLLGKVDDMQKQRISLEKQLRDLIQKDDITSTLVTTERFQMKALFEEQLQKYEELNRYIDQNLAAQDNILKALTEANVQYATVRKTLATTEQQWNSTLQSLVASFEAYEGLVKKAEEGRSFYQDMEKKTSNLLDQVKTICQSREKDRIALMGREVAKGPPPRPTARKPVLDNKASAPQAANICLGEDRPKELYSIPPNMPITIGSLHQNVTSHGAVPLVGPPGTAPFPNQRMPQLANSNQPPYGQPSRFNPPTAVLPHPASNFSAPQQFQPGPSGGVTPVFPQINPNTAPMPPQGYILAPWQTTSNMARPSLPGQQVPVPGGQFTPPVGQQMPHASQQIPPGMQYQHFPPQPGQGMMLARNALPGQNQSPVHPGQFHPPVAFQSQSQPGPTEIHWPLPHTQSAQQAPLPGQTHAQLQSGPPVHQGQFPQNQPQAPMGPPQPLSGSFQDVNKPAPVPHPASQIPFSQNSQTPFAYHSPNPHQMPPGPGLHQGSMYFQAGTPHTNTNLLPAQNVLGQQSSPAQFNPMFMAGNQIPNQNVPPQHIPSSSSGLSVMDNPNPTTLAAVLTPSPAHLQPQNQDLLHDKVDKLSIAS